MTNPSAITEQSAPNQPIESSGGVSALEPVIQISSFVESTIEMHGWEFHLNDEDVSQRQVADQEGLLPLLLWEAEKMHLQGYKASSGVAFLSDSGSLFGARPEIENAGGPRATLPLFLLEVLMNVQERYNGALDSLRDNFLSEAVLPDFPWSARSTSKSLNPTWANQAL